MKAEKLNTSEFDFESHCLTVPDLSNSRSDLDTLIDKETEKIGGHLKLRWYLCTCVNYPLEH